MVKLENTQRKLGMGGGGGGMGGGACYVYPGAPATPGVAADPSSRPAGG